MKELVIAAITKNLEDVLSFVDDELDTTNCPVKTKMQIDIAVEEIFVNIANYAYGGKTGEVKIKVELQDKHGLKITFIDKGIPYNPLEKEDPDITLSAQEREIGGLGILMTKKCMDDIKYEYKGCNILTINKVW